MRLRRAPGAALFGLCITISVSTAYTASLDSVEVTHESGRFHVVADTFLAASPAAIQAVLLDFEDDRYAQISDIYKESDYLEPDGDGTPVVYTLVEGCLLIFCRSMSRVERLEVVSPNFIRSRVVPERSDFKYAMSEWTIEPAGGGTRLVYRMAMEPDFWLPPFVGPLYLRRVLLRGGAAAVERIEALALELGTAQTASAGRR
jgi:hypothetical protein